jgi:signal transduction histidine kinase
MLEAERLQRLVEGLLVLSRSDNSTNPVLMKFDLAVIAQERVESWEALAAESGVAVRLGLVPHVIVKAISGAIEQVIDNYVDNALAISPTGSTITVNVELSETTATIHVLDEGPGIPEADIDKAFNRFWRARSDDSGSGLGLAIVERLVTASAGSVQLVNRHPHGVDAQATFNLA